jgi:hypothetical protein
MHRRRHRVAFSLAALLSLLAALICSAATSLPASAAQRRSTAVAERALAFIRSQQRNDGGFGSGESGFPGFETPDALLAIADSAQSDLTYNPAAARIAVLGVVKNGKTGLDYLDDFADGGISAGKAAQLILVASAIGLDPTTFDPQSDGRTNLVATMDGGRKADGSYGTFNDTLQVLVAHPLLNRPAPAKTVAFVEAAQQSTGGFAFSGDPAGNDEDVDTTARAIQGLVAAGRDGNAPSVRKALRFLATRHNANGSWSAFGSPDPNATAQAMLGIEAAGYTVASRCWRDMPAPGNTASSYRSPDDYLRGAQAADGHIESGADSYGVNTFATSQSVQALLRLMQPVVHAVRQACPTTGYRLVASDGGVFAFGDATFEGSTGDRTLNQPIVATAATPSGAGYWLFASDGGVFAFGDAEFYGSTGDLKLNAPIVGAAATPTGGGYWLFASDGGVFAFGDAPFVGSMGAVVLNRPVVGGASTPDGAGYWLFASDGGVFALGDARFAGSAGASPLNRPVVAGATSRAGNGYWLFASDGGVFAFGDAPFEGSMGGAKLNRAVVSGARSKGDGYYLVASDGGVFAFGDADFHGSRAQSAGPLNSPVVALQS